VTKQKKGKRADDASAGHWYAVRCVFRLGRAPDDGCPPGSNDYEERITLWLAPSLKVAIRRAEKEARRYASAVDEAPGRYLGLAQAYWMFDAPQDGAEVFSLIRRSSLKPNRYLDTFFDTGTELQD
jgi:hypothetical protein